MKLIHKWHQDRTTPLNQKHHMVALTARLTDRQRPVSTYRQSTATTSQHNRSQHVFDDKLHYESNYELAELLQESDREDEQNQTVKSFGSSGKEKKPVRKQNKRKRSSG